MTYSRNLMAAAAVAACFMGVSSAFGQRDASSQQSPDVLNILPLTAGVLNMMTGDVNALELPINLVVNPGGNFGFDENRWYVVSLNAPITPERRELLEAIGVQLGDYLPAYSYISRLGGVQPADLQRTGFVIWVGEYQNDWKIAPGIGQRPYFTEERQALADAGRVAVDITLFAGVAAELPEGDGPAVAVSQIPGAVIHIIQPLGDSMVITASMPAESVAALASINEVQFVEESPEVTIRSNNNNRWIVQSNTSGVTPVYNAGIRGEGQVVAVIDGRPNPNHCSFVDSQPFGPNHRKILAYNSSTGNDSHGTHVSGTAVGDAGSNANTRGVAYMAKMVFNTIPSFNETAVYSRLQTHHNQGARIHTNSWGNDGTTAYDGMCRGFDRFARDFEESLPVLAVTNTSSLRNPENAKNLLAVAATQGSPNQHNFCSGGAGPTADGRRKPEIMAPGCSTTSSTGGSCSTTNMTGTSMACPAVAGAGALARQYFTDGFYPTGAAVPSNAFTPSGALIKATLLNSAVDMTGMAGYPGNTEGWGRVRLDESLHFTGQTRRLAVFDVRNNNGLSTGQVATHNFAISSSTEKLKVTLVFTDVAGTAGASNPVVNDLDLEVITPGGVTYRGNVFSGGISVTGGVKDAKNNVEQVHLNNPAVGNWTARVIGANVSQQLQGYALVISGAVSVGPAPPPNDNCQNIEFVGEGATPFTTLGATTDGPNEPTHCNFNGYTHIENDVWFAHQALCNGTMTVSLCGADYDAKMVIYTGTCGNPGTPVACANNVCGLAPEVTFDVTQGVFYRVRIGGHQGATGSGTMVITCTPAAPACPADLNNSGSVDVQDLLLLLGAWGPCAGCPADLNNSGSVDVQDLLLLLGAWGPCP
ncbi:MAG TPA: S8 family serine peptidase [Phycisphaerales bacterium]|nr:S8 family serine peptidase [Phycisphaerales bacterium]